MMKWRKPSEELVKLFQEITPGPPATPKKMFGFPAAFVNGNMFMGLHQEDMILRLPEGSRAELLKMNARIFEPMPGRPMREYVIVPPSLLRDRNKLSSWVQKALEYGSSLPAKAGKKSSPKTAGKPAAKKQAVSKKAKK